MIPSFFLRGVLLICALIIAGCAKQVAPAGGPRDEAPPRPVSIVPSNFSTGFSSPTITIRFDEYIDLRNAAGQIFMSPSGNQPLEITSRKKTLAISVPDTLRAATTYTIYFGNAIRDVNEGNILDNFQYVFSTGTYIDSLGLQGFVYDAWNGKPAEGVTVMLYSSQNDSAVVRQIPDYYAKTDKQGYFRFRYLKEAHYSVRAIRDMNNNLLFDSGEPIAFIDSMIHVKDTTSMVVLQLFGNEISRQSIKQIKAITHGRIQVLYSIPAESPIAVIKGPPDIELPFIINESRDTVIYYSRILLTDSILLSISDRGIDSTVRLRMPPLMPRDTARSKTKTLNEPALNLVKGREGLILPYKQPLRLIFPEPVFDVDTNRIHITRNDTTSPIHAQIHLLNDSISQKQMIRLQFDPVVDSIYRLRLADGYAVDQFNRPLKAVNYTFRYGSSEASGSLKINVINLDTNIQYVIVLKAPALYFQKRWIVSNTKSKEFSIQHLVPGNYQLQIIRDTNRNGRWNTGNYWTRKQPEQIINYTGGVTIRANWDAEITLSGRESRGKAGKEKF